MHIAQFSQVAPTTTATEVVAAYRSRKQLSIRNVGTVDVYLGTSNAVTASNGYLLAAGETYDDADTGSAYYAITASGTADLRVLEVK